MNNFSESLSGEILTETGYLQKDLLSLTTYLGIQLASHLLQ